MLDALSWYGCIIMNEENSPVLFPVSRMGYLMDGAEISDEEKVYTDLGFDKISIVRCYFTKDGYPISPEQASEDYAYQDLGFHVTDLSEVSVSSMGNSIGNLYEFYQEDPDEFRQMLEYVMNNFMEEDMADKRYLGFAIMTNDKDEGPYLYAMNKLGQVYPGFSYKAQDKMFEQTEGLTTAKIMELQFMDGTQPITITEAQSRMENEPENIFITAENIGNVELQHTYDSWDEALDADYDNTMNTLRMAMYALQEQAAQQEEE